MKFNKDTEIKKINAYMIPGVDYAEFREERKQKSGKPYMKCWNCHHYPCICNFII